MNIFNSYLNLIKNIIIDQNKKGLLSIPDTLRFYEYHSLVLINNGGASFDEVTNLLYQIKSKILEKFKIELEIEPEIISS